VHVSSRETFLEMVVKKQKSLHDIYYDIDNVGAYGGVKQLQKKSNLPSAKVKQWLSKQTTYTLHKPLRRRFATRAYRVPGLNHLWQMDLMEMIPFARINKGNKYILTCIDVFSRYAYAQQLKSKSGVDVAKAMENILKSQSPPRFIQTDLGKEFYNKHVSGLLKKHGIKHYSVKSQFKCAVVERFNRTLREKLSRYFTRHGHKKWVDVLDRIITTYNKTKHGGIFNMKPKDVNKENEHQLWQQMERQDSGVDGGNLIPLFNYVRISQLATNMPFRRNFEQNWSDEVFQVIKVDKRTNPIMYVIQDGDNNVIEGKFYREELQDIGENPPSIYRIEKIIRSKGKGKHKQYLVKWHGYSFKHNSWIKASDLQ